MGAHELRNGVAAAARPPGSPELLAALTVSQLFDAVAIRVDGPRAWDEELTIDWRFTDLGRDPPDDPAQRRADPPAGRRPGGGRRPVGRTRPRPQLLGVLLGGGLDGIDTEGDVGVLARLVPVVEFGGAQLPDRHPVGRAVTRRRGRSADEVDDVHDQQREHHGADDGVDGREQPLLVVVGQPEPADAEEVEGERQHPDGIEMMGPTPLARPSSGSRIGSTM